MTLGPADVAELRRLEESLWRRETRFDDEYMRRVTVDDFFEFGQSGRVYSRDECLAIPEQDIGAVLLGLTVRWIAPTVALVTYQSEVGEPPAVQVANRSSLWIKTGAGWRLQFHQGTPRSG